MNKTKLFRILQKHYSIKTIYAILSGDRKPNYEVMTSLYEENKIPFTAWKDIKSYISNSNNTTKKSITKRGQ